MQAAALNIEEYEKIQPFTDINEGGKTLRYWTPNRFTKWRVESIRTKEPDTLTWIAGFKNGDILVDIGANVGMYTIWAAKTREVQVFAFEPESQNYALLNKNIYINDMAGWVRAYSVALSDTEGFSDLYLSQFSAGGSCHTFGEQVDFNLKPFNSAFNQGCYSTTLDKLVAQGTVPVPHHIKIDVDGIEHKVIKGSEKTLTEAKLESVLIELNTNLELHRDLIGYMKSLGYGLSKEQLDIAIRTSGTFTGVGNHIFRRDLA